MERFCLDKITKKWFNVLDGDIAQMARALAWHARGREFESPYLHKLFV